MHRFQFSPDAPQKYLGLYNVAVGRRKLVDNSGELQFRLVGDADERRSFAKPERLELLGPLLMLVGMALLGMLPELPSFGRGGGSGMSDKLMSFGLAGRAYLRLQSAQRWLGPASGWLLVAIGVWMC